jgi:hypothetical protein
MSPVTLDPTPALVLIDLQKGIVGLATAHPAEEVVTRGRLTPLPFGSVGWRWCS